MTDDNQPLLPDHETAPAIATTLARTGAVVLAVSVVAYLVYRAQSRAKAELPPAGNLPAVGTVPELLPSSKFRVITDGAFFNDGSSPERPAASEEEFTVLPSSKSLVLKPAPTLLFRSKSGAPVTEPAPAAPAPAAPAPAGGASKKAVGR